MDTRRKGKRGEDQACRYIEEMGGRIVERNYRTRMGEIDIVAEDRGILCFVEVKYRKDRSAGYPAEAVDARKQYIISRVSDHYRMRRHLSEDRSFRFDVLSIMGDDREWLKDAFPYIP